MDKIVQKNDYESGGAVLKQLDLTNVRKEDKRIKKHMLGRGSIEMRQKQKRR